MMKAIKVLYYASLSVSMLVGLWHFFVPRLFRWYDYLPMQYENLIVGIITQTIVFPPCCLGLALF